jgi:hypothetical protein
MTRDLLPVSRAPDILLDPSKSPLPRYAAYRRARARFWEAFPGGLFTRLPTPSTGLDGGYYALILSMEHQLPPGTRIPTLGELRAVFRGGEVARASEDVGLLNGRREGDAGLFTADQLAAVFAAWGRRYLNQPGQGRVRCQLGWITNPVEEEGEKGWPAMMNTPEVETGQEGEGIVRVWIWNDGISLKGPFQKAGGFGHFEGIRRPSAREVEEAERKDLSPALLLLCEAWLGLAGGCGFQ